MVLGWATWMWGFGSKGATSMLVHHFVDGRSSLVTDSKPLKIPEMQHKGWLIMEHHQVSTRVSSTDVKIYMYNSHWSHRFDPRSCGWCSWSILFSMPLDIYIYRIFINKNMYMYIYTVYIYMCILNTQHAPIYTSFIDWKLILDETPNVPSWFSSVPGTCNWPPSLVLGNE
jgi:hypothetical protein